MTDLSKFSMQCRKLNSQGICQASCCGLVPFDRELFTGKLLLLQREFYKIEELGNNEVLPMTKDMKCVFLTKQNKCAIYEQRPTVCRDYGLIEDMPCPLIGSKGNIRSPAKAKRTQRQIDHRVYSRIRNGYFGKVERK